MTCEFRIVPGGIHPLFIGMDRRQIDDVMHESPAVEKSRIAGEEVLRFAQARIVMRDDRVVEIGLSPPARVFLRAKLLFDDPVAWRDFVATGEDVQECLGFIVLRAQGFTLTGFHDGNPSQRAVTAFEPGRWDAMDHAMKPFRLNPSNR